MLPDYFKQTIRIWSLESKDCKAELNGHDHVVECVSWAPDTAKSSILKAAGYDVSFMAKDLLNFGVN